MVCWLTYLYTLSFLFQWDIPTFRITHASPCKAHKLGCMRWNMPNSWCQSDLVQFNKITCNIFPFFLVTFPKTLIYLLPFLVLVIIIIFFFLFYGKHLVCCQEAPWSSGLGLVSAYLLKKKKKVASVQGVQRRHYPLVEFLSDTQMSTRCQGLSAAPSLMPKLRSVISFFFQLFFFFLSGTNLGD